MVSNLTHVVILGPVHPGRSPWSATRPLQIAGLPFDTDKALLRDDPAASKFAVFHVKRSQFQAVNAPRGEMGKVLVANPKPADMAKLANENLSMKEVAA